MVFADTKQCLLHRITDAISEPTLLRVWHLLRRYPRVHLQHGYGFNPRISGPAGLIYFACPQSLRLYILCWAGIFQYGGMGINVPIASTTMTQH